MPTPEHTHPRPTQPRAPPTMHTRPTHAHTHPRWIPSLSSSSIPFLHPTPPPDFGDPRRSPPPSSPPRGHLSPLTISIDRFLSSPRRATPRHWWWCTARRPQRRRAAAAAGTATCWGGATSGCCSCAELLLLRARQRAGEQLLLRARRLSFPQIPIWRIPLQPQAAALSSPTGRRHHSD